MEEFGGEVFSGYLLEDFVYGDDDSEKLHKSFDIPGLFGTMKSWSSKEWADLITKYVILVYSITISMKQLVVISRLAGG